MEYEIERNNIIKFDEEEKEIIKCVLDSYIVENGEDEDPLTEKHVLFCEKLLLLLGSCVQHKKK
jgi:hypothetical protein